MDLQLAGKRAFVSGSTRGIGRAVAGALVAEGVDVVIHGRDQDRVEQAVTALGTGGGGARVSGLAADLADPAQVRRLVAQLGEVSYNNSLCIKQLI